VSKHYSPTKKQLDILRLLYRFRFATSDQLTQALNAKRTNLINQRLKLLLDQQYISRKYEPEYHLLRKHAAYYLLPGGIEALKRIAGGKFSSSVFRSIRNDHNRSDQFTEECLSVFEIFCQLKAAYGDSLHFFTRSQLVNRYDYFADFVPGVYIRIVTDGAEKDYFLEYLQSSKPFFTVIQRVKQYSDFADSGEWEEGTGSDLPKVLFVCDMPSLQKRILKRATGAMESDDLNLYVTTKDELKNGSNTACTDLSDPDEVLTLSSI
jgi:hypothetical protein